ncbi:MAG: hypothetical protein WEB29_11015 [Chloroflexota bacterium]
MTAKLWLGAFLIAVGIAALIVAPQAQSCFSESDSRACETIGTIAFNVVGVGLIVAGGILVVVGVRHKIRA